VITIQKIHVTAASWQDRGKCFGVKGSDSCWFFVWQWMHSIIVTCFTMMCTKQFGRKDLGNCRRSYCMMVLVHVRQIWQRQPSSQPWLSLQLFSFVWASEGALRRIEISNWWWTQM
jgi:hypothetical protein